MSQYMLKTLRIWRGPIALAAGARAGGGRADGPGPGTRARGPAPGGPAGTAAGTGAWRTSRTRRLRRPRRVHDGRAEGRRAVRQEQGRAAGCGGAHGCARAGWPRTGGVVSPVGPRPRRPRHGADVAGPEAGARRRPRLHDRAALRRQDAADDLPAVRECGMGAGARGLQQHRRRSARDRDRRRQDLQGRRRAFPRRLVLHDGAAGVEALAEPDVRLRPREPEPARLPDAEPAQREQRSDVRAGGALLGDRPRLPAGAEDELRPGGHQRRELGRLRQRAAIQQGLPARQLQDRQRGALEGAGQPGRPRRHGVPGRRPRALQADLSDQAPRTIPRCGPR